MKTKFIQSIQTFYRSREPTALLPDMRVEDGVEFLVPYYTDVYTARVSFGAAYSLKHGENSKEVPKVIQDRLAEQVYGEVRSELRKLEYPLYEVRVRAPKVYEELRKIIDGIHEMITP